MVEKEAISYDAADDSFERKNLWIHVDGALGASFMPFVEMAKCQKVILGSGPKFDFQLEHVNSIVTSGHKWPGAPMPTGVYISKHKYLRLPKSQPSYIGSLDS